MVQTSENTHTVHVSVERLLFFSTSAKKKKIPKCSHKYLRTDRSLKRPLPREVIVLSPKSLSLLVCKFVTEKDLPVELNANDSLTGKIRQKVRRGCRCSMM